MRADSITQAKADIWYVAPREPISWWHRMVHRFKLGHGRVWSAPTETGYVIGFECATCGGVPQWTIVERTV